jgi:hypothetical protein
MLSQEAVLLCKFSAWCEMGVNAMLSQGGNRIDDRCEMGVNAMLSQGVPAIQA